MELPTEPPSETTVGEEYFDCIQWYIHNNGLLPPVANGNCWMFDDISCSKNFDCNYNLDEQFSNNKSNRKCIVAVIDTGCKLDNNLYRNIWKNSNEVPNDKVDNDNNGYVDDVFGWNFVDNNNNISSETISNHGDKLLSVLCSTKVNYIDLVEYEDCDFLIIKAIDSESLTSKTENIIKAIEYAQNNGAVICSMSIEVYKNDEILRQTIEKSNMLFVVPSGNESANLSNELQTYPSCWNMKNVISVGSIRCDGNLSYESNYSSEYVDILAPGTDICCFDENGKMIYDSGTSFATVIVTALAEKLYCYSDIELKASEIKEYICNNGRVYSDYSSYVKTSALVDYTQTINALNAFLNSQ